MEILITILIVVTLILYLQVRRLKKYLDALSFSEHLINKLLVKKGLISPMEIDIITNEIIGDMPEDEGNRIIKCFKSIGITVPEYMDEEALKKYIEKQELKRRNSQISYSDKIIMESFKE